MKIDADIVWTTWTFGLDWSRALQRVWIHIGPLCIWVDYDLKEPR